MYLVEIINKNGTAPIYQHYNDYWNIFKELEDNKNVDYFTIYEEIN